jgi:anti-anti-sigma factor
VTRVHIPTNRGLLDLLRTAARIPGPAARAPRVLLEPALSVLAVPLSLISVSQIAWLTRLVAAAVNSQAGEDHLGVCVACGEPVDREDPFLRYSGEYYHAGSCLESNPPALQARTQLTVPPSPRAEDAVVELRLALAQDTVWVLPIGQLDLATVSQLGARVQSVSATGVGHVIIDLRAVSFIDSSGVELLTAIATEARADGWQLSLIQGAPAIRRVFAHTDSLRQLPFTSMTTLLGT